MIKIRENVPLAQYTYYKIGGKAEYFCEVKDGKDIIEALQFSNEKKLPFFVLGGGANVLISDSGFNGLVIRIKNTGNDIEIINSKSEIRNTKQIQNSKFEIQNSEHIRVNAGTKLSDLVNFSLKNGLSGLEWAAGIPGTVGGAVRGNAGAFNGEMGNVVESIVAVCHSEAKPKNLIKEEILHCVQDDKEENMTQVKSDNSGYKIKTFSNKQCAFGYRTSVIKEQGGVILSVTLKFKKITNKDLIFKNQEEAKNHIKYRKEHHPLKYPSCGSVFKNVDIGKIREIGDIRGKGDIIPAGLLIAKAGLAGKRIGDAQISEKHSNFIINLRNATAEDVYKLIQFCQKEVYKKFGVKLGPEVEFVGFKKLKM
ncbi:MAG: FAD-binding protein [Candidatus Paceibacterota bacterium]|jgi:UDP-N-acetylmuramate dehydrogenase